MKLEAFDLIDNWHFIVATKNVLYHCIVFNQVVVEVRHFNKLWFCMQKMVHVRRN
jgi:hypothetical protein